MLSTYFKELVLALYPFRKGRVRLILWLFRNWRGAIVAKDKFGLKLCLDGLNYIDSRVLADGCYECEAIEAFCAGVREHNCDMFIDVGANIGIYSLGVARTTECPKIVAFEPDAQNRNQLAANIFLNGYDDRITIRSEAASDHQDSAILYAQRDESGLSSGRSRLTPLTEEAYSKMEVSLAKIDDLLPFRDLKLAIKMDIEGHELQALKGNSLYPAKRQRPHAGFQPSDSLCGCAGSLCHLLQGHFLGFSNFADT